MAKRKGTKNELQNNTQKTKDRKIICSSLLLQALRYYKGSEHIIIQE